MIPVQNARCFICQEAIFNPICPSCIKKEVLIWLKNLKPDLIEELNKYIAPFQNPQNNDINCIICKKTTDTCPYCFTEYVYEWLKLKHPDLLESFLMYFNYDFEHTGYSKDVEW